MFYEITYIIPATTPPEEQESIKEKVTHIIQEQKGKIIVVPPSEKRKLSYIIKKTRQGLFQYIRFSTDREHIADIHKEVKMISGILRFIIVKLPVRSATDAQKLEVPSITTSMRLNENRESGEEKAPHKQPEHKQEQEKNEEQQDLEKKPEEEQTEDDGATKKENEKKEEKDKSQKQPEQIQEEVDIKKLDETIDKILEGDLTR